MNTVGPYPNRQETYGYFSLFFCKGSKTYITHYHETLAEAIQGIELKFSGLDIDFKGEPLFRMHNRYKALFDLFMANYFFSYHQLTSLKQFIVI